MKFCPVPAEDASSVSVPPALVPSLRLTEPLVEFTVKVFTATFNGLTELVPILPAAFSVAAMPFITPEPTIVPAVLVKLIVPVPFISLLTVMLPLAAVTESKPLTVAAAFGFKTKPLVELTNNDDVFPVPLNVKPAAVNANGLAAVALVKPAVDNSTLPVALIVDRFNAVTVGVVPAVMYEPVTVPSVTVNVPPVIDGTVARILTSFP